MWRYLILVTLCLLLIGLGTLAFLSVREQNLPNKDKSVIISPFSNLRAEKLEPRRLAEIYPLGNPINILLMGIDRRSKAEFGYRTDIMILLSINPQANQVVLTSIPRDLWYDGGKINGLFLGSGWESMKTAVLNVTGYTPQRYIITDFEDFSWIVDALGGVPVEVATSFTDTGYPIDATLEYQTVSFIQGRELLTGERALIYARSRKGDNGEGSDWARMRRQHKILTGMLSAIIQPGSLFNPMVVENAFKMVTTGRMETNLKLEDARYLWDFYQDKDKYNIHSLFLDYDYLYSPPPEEYGGAWTIVPLDGNYRTFQSAVRDSLNGTVNKSLPNSTPADQINL